MKFKTHTLQFPCTACTTGSLPELKSNWVGDPDYSFPDWTYGPNGLTLEGGEETAQVPFIGPPGAEKVYWSGNWPLQNKCAQIATFYVTIEMSFRS